MSRQPYTAFIAIVICISVMFLPIFSKKIYDMNLYTICFVLGSLIPRFGHRLVAGFDTFPRVVKGFSIAATLLTFMFARAVIAPVDTSPAVILLETASAMLIVSLILFRPSGSLLRSLVAQEIGRISYGIYLFHLLVLFVIAQALLPVLQPSGIIAELAAVMILLTTGLVITIPLSWFVHIAFESKLQTFGRRISKALEGRTDRSNQELRAGQSS